MRQPSFGMNPTVQLLDTIRQAMGEISASQKVEGVEEDGPWWRRWGRNIMTTAVLTPLLASALANIDVGRTMMRKIENRKTAIPLEQVLKKQQAVLAEKAAAAEKESKTVEPKTADPPKQQPVAPVPLPPPAVVTSPPAVASGTPVAAVATPPVVGTPVAVEIDPAAKLKEMENQIRMFRVQGILLEPNNVLKAAENGFIKEVWEIPADTSIAVLVDGTEVYCNVASLLPPVKEKLSAELQIPVRLFKPWSLSWVQASFLAGLVAGALSSMIPKKKKAAPPGVTLTHLEKLRIATSESARFLVGMKLEVPALPVTRMDVEKQLEKLRLTNDLQPMTLEQLRRRLAVLMAPKILEERLFPGDPSLTSLGAVTTASQVAVLMVMQMGLGGDDAVKNGFQAPVGLTDALKEKITRAAADIVSQAEARARTVLAEYTNAQLENLQKAFQELENITPDEGKALLSGKTVDDIKKQRQ